MTDYLYNHDERLISVQQDGIPVGAYAYNPYGQRIRKEAAGQITWYLYSDAGLAAAYDNSGALLNEYHYKPGRPWMTDPLFQRSGSGDVHYYQNDHLGTPQRLLAANGDVVWEARYSAFGQAETVTQRVENNLRFPGQYYDAESGLHHSYHRDYDPATGRYVQSDPIGLNGGLNTYAYVGGNPLSFVDPLGLHTEIIIWQPVGRWASSFGHVSSNINGTNYSWGPGGWDTKYPNASDYANRQKTFRSGVGQILNLTPEQEQKLAKCYAKRGGDYSVFTKNCGDPHKDCLQEVLGNSLSD